MDKLNRFFWFCSGAHIPTLEKYPSEQNKYTGIGATIFFTGLFAALSGGYAMYFVFKGDNLAVIFAIVFGFLWVRLSLTWIGTLYPVLIKVPVPVNSFYRQPHVFYWQL